MRFIAFINAQEQPALGARIGDEVVDLGALGLPSTLDELLRQGDAGMTAARAAVARSTQRRPLASLRLLPPVQHPSKAFAIGLNYADHASESKFDLPKHPVIFQRFVSSWVAHDEPIVRPKVSTQFDYEAELVAVIGKAGRYIPKDRALEHVAGYSIFNEGSIRDFQFRSAQWLWGKNFDRSGSFGPEFVTADELPPGATGLQIRLRLNGELLQDANTRDMIFDVATLVAACSEGMALQPGDIIITGTPSGVGLARKPQVWLKPGDICEVEVQGVGVLRNPVRDEEGPSADRPTMTIDRLPPLRPEQWTAEQRISAEEIIAGPRGALISPFVPLLRSPELMGHAQRMGEYLRYRNCLGQRLSELAILITARQWMQQVEWVIHAPIALREGIGAETVQAVGEGRRPERMSNDEAIVHDFCIELHRHRNVSDGTWAAVVERFGERGAIDLIGLNGYYSLLAMVMNAARTVVPPSTVEPLLDVGIVRQLNSRD